MWIVVFTLCFTSPTAGCHTVLDRCASYAKVAGDVARVYRDPALDRIQVFRPNTYDPMPGSYISAEPPILDWWRA